ncbi:hypothetical protein [uncultured Methanobrevibacter sp.]|uniref:hypothetical protein n=1 Tax=uncultured Methanobrevibacter sp. TaxID=253161 RepID=UPI0025FAB518|nr:hypothetical protein [uncultured Methanobrevibacter sp.]
MSRTYLKFKSTNREEEEQTILRILEENKYKKRESQGEEFYQHGSGIVTSPQLIKYTFKDDMIVIESWVRNFGFFGEDSLDGSSQIFAKRSAKGALKKIQEGLGLEIIEQGTL